MTNYEIVEDSGSFKIFECRTDQCIKILSTKFDAESYCKLLENSRSGLGLTSPVFLAD